MGGGVWSPIDLFGAGESGFIFDPAALSNIWQDDAGTTPAANLGDPVGKLADISGNGNHRTQGTPAARPLVVAGGMYQFDGLNDGISGPVDMSAGGAWTYVVRLNALNDTQYVLASGSNIAIAFFGVADSASGASSVDGIAQTLTSMTVDGVGVSDTRSALQAALAGGEKTLVVRLSALLDGGGWGGLFGIGIYPAFAPAILVGREILINRDLSANELNAASAWVAAGGADSDIPFELVPSEFSETGTVIDRGDYMETSPFSMLNVQTSATVVEVDLHTGLFGPYPMYAHITVLVDGAYHSKLNATADGLNTATAYLPAGDKAVSFVSGLQSKPGATVLGTNVVSLRGNADMAQVSPAPADRILFYGDSITVGGNSDTPAVEGYSTLVRAAHAGSVAVEGYGYRALHNDCVDATARAAFVAKIVAYAPERIWLAIGTNDYGLNKWTAANFGTAYAALLDDLHTALPSATIFCQTPLLRTTETANGSGSTMGDYRTQISTAVSTRTAYATLVDGTTIMTTASLVDGVHPTTAGHVLYANAVKTMLGI